MSREETLKKYIIAKYKSVRQFTIATGLKYSTVVAILSRDLGGAAVENVIAICKALNISTDALAEDGIIVELAPKEPPKMPERIEAYLNIFKIREDSEHYTIDGKPLTEEERKQFRIGMELLIDFIRRQREAKE